MDKYDRIDVIVNNAGIMPIAHMAALKVEEWDRMIDVNIKGLLYGVAAVLPIMQKQKQGVDGARQRIICGSSAGPKSGGPCKHTLKRLSARIYGPCEMDVKGAYKWQMQRKQQLLLAPREGSARDSSKRS
jgi:NAD(P)-dependent dehydrogenase (short-subunit alcohol dehydrogenase family)